MALVALYDACVLYPAPLRDTLMRVAVKRLVRARWTNRILDETFRSILKQRPDLPSDQLERTRARMNAAVPDCLVDGYESLEGGLTLPDADDRHVLAAAIHAGADIIVTSNLKDFPADALAPHHLEAQHPDEFLVGLIDRSSGLVLAVIHEQAAALVRPPITVEDLLATLQQNGLTRSVARLRDQLGE